MGSRHGRAQTAGRAGEGVVCLSEYVYVFDSDDSSTGTTDVVVVVVDDVFCCSALCDTRGKNERMTMEGFSGGEPAEV